MDPLSLLSAVGPLLGAVGSKPGDINVSQSASNTTALSISNIISNQSPGTIDAPLSGNSAQGAAGSGAGSAPPLTPTPLQYPDMGYGEASYSAPAAAVPEGIPKVAFMAGAVALAGGVYLIFFRKKR